MNSPQQSALTLLFIIFLGYLSSTTAYSSKLLDHFCGSTGNYSANSTYDLNLQTLFKNLTTSATNSTSNYGFAKGTVGSMPNEIFGIVLCRGDVSSSECSSCISQATVDIQNICPYNKESTIYYDFCLLRFSSNQDFLSPTNNSKGFYRFTANNVSVSIDRFYNLVDYLLNSTSDYAAYNDTKKFGTSTLTDPNFPVIRGLTQCRPDISGSTCQSCLQNLTRIPEIFKGRQGGRIVNMMCNFRYEIYSFYEGASLLTVAPLADNAPARVPTATKRTSTVTILAITISLVLAFVALACLYVCYFKRRKSFYFFIRVHFRMAEK